MGWSDAIEEGLPSRRDDEPPDLRRDIADELGDHLACAMQRELRNANDEQTAQTNVISRFGSPQQIARRLWWDAMKEKIMSQRITLAAAVVAAIASICTGLVAWHIADQARTANASLLSQSRELNERLIGQNQKLNQKLLDRLEELPAAQPVEKIPEWTEVRFQVSMKHPDGPPAERFLVELRGRMHNPPDNTLKVLEAKTDGNGIATIGPIRPGEYRYTVTAPWNSESSGEIKALRVPRTEEKIVYPTDPPELGRVKISITWPEQLRRLLAERNVADPWVSLRFRPVEAPAGYRNWRPGYNFGAIVATDGSILNRGSKTIDLKQNPPQDHVNWPIGDYRLEGIGIHEHHADAETAHLVTINLLGVHIFQRRDFSGGDGPVFRVDASQRNTWNVELPLIELKETVLRNSAREGEI